MRPRSWFSLAVVTLGALVAPVVGSFSVTGTGIGIGVASADDGSGVDCSIRGKGVIEKSVTVWSEKSGGTAIAQFATQEVALEVSDFPADSTGRARVRTGGTGASFRLGGWIDPTKIPISAKGDIAIVPDHVW